MRRPKDFLTKLPEATTYQESPFNAKHKHKTWVGWLPFRTFPYGRHVEKVELHRICGKALSSRPKHAGGCRPKEKEERHRCQLASKKLDRNRPNPSNPSSNNTKRFTLLSSPCSLDFRSLHFLPLSIIQDHIAQIRQHVLLEGA